MIEWGIIGITVGFLLGLTGAGGAVIAVPFFIYLTGTSLAQATLYSLFAVVMGAAIGWVPQRRFTDWRTVPLFLGFSLLSSALFVRVKSLSPEWLVAILFVSVCALSLFTIWSKRDFIQPKAQTPHSFMIRGGIGGLMLGALVTMTGLGGGVILMPILLGWMRLPMRQATATSLLTICLTSLASLGLQFHSLPSSIDLARISSMAAGSLLSSFAVKRLVERYESQILDTVRRWMITSVVAGAALSVVIGP